MLLTRRSSRCRIRVSPWVWSGAQRHGNIAARVWSYRCHGHSLGLVVLFVTIGSLHPIWLSFTVFHFDHSKTFPCPLPLLLSKPCSSPCTTTFFLSFPQSLIETCIHLPLTFPFFSPFSRSIHFLCTLVFYYYKCIFSIPFLQTRILIDNCRNNKNVPPGPLKNSLSASL